jgi:adenine-specific DNA-methyltransferase
MAQIERQQTVLHILQNLRDLAGLKKLFWEELNYERENESLSMRGWPDSVRKALGDDPILFASGGEDNAFHVLYCRLASDSLQRTIERPIVNQLIREHPYCLFVFSDTSQSAWHFLNVKYDEKAEKRRLFRRITVQAGSGLRTAAERLQMMDLALMGKDLFGIPTLEIQKRHDDAFDVESVTKAFYKELANWYFWALKHVRFPKDAPKEADGHDHIGVIRMITRLIFCWFVKEKGLIPEVLFDQRQLDELLDGFAPGKDARKDSVFYKAILQNLFFATLNTEMDKRGWARDEQNFMAHSLYRHRDLFKKSGEALALFRNIPFLNGGLFECMDKDLGENVRPRYVRIDGFSRRPDSQPVVPDFLFFGPEREEDLSADYGDRKFRKVRVGGLIHTLRQYHFTIEENTPIEQEVALDPELSGKVFENLLAAYNPETGATARKQTGSFYTPREIVDYMVDEALIAHLKTKLEANQPSANNVEERLRHLFAYNEEPHQFSAKGVDVLIDAIDHLKALDPAVGSGAFPMGILHKLVFILGKLDSRNEQWEQRQIQRVRDAIATAEKIEDAAIRERTVKELEQQIIGIEESFKRNELDYGRKLYLIENCLYGVDIQSIAVQIAKMRFFISLIVDQRVDSSAPNLGVRPLPNLETKFVAANTLIGIEKPKQMLLRNPQIDAKEAELRRVRERHFTARTLLAKAKCREQDKKLRSEIAELLRSDGWGDTTAKQLAAWDPYDQNASAPFFDPEWMFGVREGFDVVIGNPPYMGFRDMNKDLKQALKRRYECAEAKFDLYLPFIEQGLHLAAGSGLLLYICPTAFMRRDYGRALRCLLSQNSEVKEIVDFEHDQIFGEATNYTGILFIRNVKPSDQSVVRYRRGIGSVPSVVAQHRMTEQSWIFTGSGEQALIDHIRADSMPLGSLATISEGIVTGMNELYLQSKEAVQQQFGYRFFQPCLRGREIGVYVHSPCSEYVFYPYEVKNERTQVVPEKYIASGNPNYFRYLRSHHDRLIARGYFAKSRKVWYELWNQRNLENLRTRKIITPELSDRNRFCIAEGDVFYGDTVCGIVPKTQCDSGLSLSFLLGLLNSALLEWLYKKTTVPKAGGFFIYKVMFLRDIPIYHLDLSKRSDRAKHEAIVKLVERILAAKAVDPAADTSALEREIDRLVYELYGLTEEEIAIVEGAAGKGEK